MRLRPSERLTVVFLLALSLATAILRPEGGAVRLAVLGALLAGHLALARAPAGRSLLGWVRALFPVVTVGVVFSMLQPIIEAANPRRWDAVLATFDARFLVGLVAAWRGALGGLAPLVDVVYLAYVSYYLLPVVVAVATLARRGPDGYEQAAFPILLTFWLSFVGYFLFPAEGPRLPAAQEAVVVGGGAVSDAVRAFLHSAEATTLDAFPSGHTAVSLVSAWAGARAFPRAGRWLWAWALLIVFATVFIHVHYAVDVLGGLALTGVAIGAATPRRSTSGRGLAAGGRAVDA